MNLRFAITLLLLGTVPGAAMASPNNGDRCTLSVDVRMSARKAGKGKKTTISPGESLTVLKRTRRWTRVQYGSARGYLRTKAIAKHCRADEAEPAPAAEADPPAPEAVMASPVGEQGLGTDDASAESKSFNQTYKIKIAVMDLKASGELHESLISSLTAVVPETLDRLGIFKAISSEEIRQMLQFESTKQMLGCDDMSCLAEIGGALGADFLLTGGITGIGGTFVIQLTLTNVSKMRVEQRTSREFAGDSQGLFDQVRSASKVLVRELLGERSGTLMVEVSEEGASIQVDGSIVGVSPLTAPLTVAGGVHTMVVEKTGFVVSRRDLTIVEDQPLRVDVHLLPSADFIRAYEKETGFVRSMAWLSLGVGVAGIGAAGALYVWGADQASSLEERSAAYNELDDRPNAEFQKLNRQEEDLALIDAGTTIAAGIGLVATAVGVVLFAVGEDPDRYVGQTTAGAGDQPPSRVPGLPPFGLMLSPTGLSVVGSF